MINVQHLRADYLINKYIGNFSISKFDFGSYYSSFFTFALIASILIFILFIIRKALFIRRILKENSVILELTPPALTERTAYSTQQFFSLIHHLGAKGSFFNRILGIKQSISFEIVSSKNQGIKYLLRTTADEVNNIKRYLISYLPEVRIKPVNDYLPNRLEDQANLFTKVVEYKLGRNFAYPLQKQDVLKEHDPVGYITGMMTKLLPDELISFQIVIAPTKLKETNTIKSKIFQGEDVFAYLDKFKPPASLQLVRIPLLIVGKLLGAVISTAGWCMQTFFDDLHGNKTPRWKLVEQNRLQKQAKIYNTFEQEAIKSIEEKIDQQLFETKIRLFVSVRDKSDLAQRLKGFKSALGVFDVPGYQSIDAANNLGFGFLNKLKFFCFRNRMISLITGASQTILSASEISDIYHFPYADTTKTDSLIKSKSKDLPAPLSQKKSTTVLDVVVGKNRYGDQEQPIGLTANDRKQHTYIVGKTGSGKTTIIKNMALQDITSGKGVCVIDPHGDMVEEILTLIPKHRRKDVVYINPSDKEFPVGLNILVPNTSFEDEDEAHVRISRSLMSVFMKITPKDSWGQRMEHILRNATLTALQIKTPSSSTPYISLLAIQKLLTDMNYQKEVVSTLTDPVLKQFWDKEFKAYGNMQRADVTGPLTNKLGEFITDKMSRHILLQEHSTINIQKIMDEGKILLVNLSKGNLGEERSAFFGTLIISLIQLAIYSRAQQPAQMRREFFVYVDEFQNFATDHFTSIFSESRKYNVFFIPSHQNIAQIDDPKTAKVVLSNSGNFIALKNGPDDERILLPFLEPEVEKGEIVNLAPHHFYMKVTNGDSEDAFSGETILTDTKGSDIVAREIIANSQKNYATSLKEVEKQLEKLFNVVPNRAKKKTVQAKSPLLVKPKSIKSSTKRVKLQLV